MPQYDVTNHLKESKIGAEYVVEVDFWVLPRDVHLRGLVHAFHFAGNDRRVDDVAVDVDARTKPSAEQVDAHDTEDEPEHETDEQNVEDGRDRLD